MKSSSNDKARAAVLFDDVAGDVVQLRDVQGCLAKLLEDECPRADVFEVGGSSKALLPG